MNGPDQPTRALEPDFLYRLLPRFIRNRDFYEGQPLRALMEVLESENRSLWENVDDLYHDWFIETCDPWVVPYIGDLIGLGEDAALHDRFYYLRALVANSIAYRRRKGIPVILARVAQDATGWPTLAIQTSRRLVRAQSLARLHPNEGGSAEVGDPAALATLDGPFDAVARTVDVRSPDRRREQPYELARSPRGGNLPAIALYVWRLGAFPLTRTPASAAGERRYRFHPLGVDTRLFNLPGPPDRLTDPITEEDLPVPLRRRPLALELDARRHDRPPPTDYFGPRPVLEIFDGEEAIAPERIEIADLDAWTAPRDGAVAVDPMLGRLVFAADPAGPVRVSFAYGFSGGLGGSSYAQAGAAALGTVGRWRPPPAAATAADPLGAALEAWREAGRPDGLIEIGDLAGAARRYEIDLTGDRRLTVAARGSVGVLDADLVVKNGGLSPRSRLRLQGLWIRGGVMLADGVGLEVADCTLRPRRGSASLTVDAASGASIARVAIARAIVGPIRHRAGDLDLTVGDSILDGDSAAALSFADGAAATARAVATLSRVTVFGRVKLTELRAADGVLFTAPVRVTDLSEGGVRYSFVPAGSRTPPRLRCQPDLALAEARTPAEKAALRARLRPVFTSRRYGDPGYAQLAQRTAPEIRAGGEAGSEIGAFAGLRQPQREAALTVTTSEYVPYGMEASLTYVT